MHKRVKDRLHDCQCRAGYYFSGGGAVGCQPICAPIMLRLINEGRRHEPSAAGARFV
jgi:hypothetical protein